jgi:multiple sugar transport system ATP-binding protein
MTSIELEGVNKQFGDVLAVSDANADIEDGEFVSIVGPSGCGKTTTLRIIAGLETATDGTLRFGPEEVTNAQPEQRNVGMVFQNLALYPHMTVRENMAFGLRIDGVSKDEQRERVEDAARMLDIEELLDRQPKELSGGQQQRVAIGRTMVLDPDVFLLDEPLASLDAKLRVEIREELQELHKQVGITTIYVTHDQEQAMTMSDRVIVMNDGEIQQFDTPEEIYRNPNNAFVAHFIGTPSMNFFEATVTSHNSVVVDTGFSKTTLPDCELPSDVDRVQVGIRPEHLEINHERDEGFDAHVKFVEPTGKDKIVHLETGETELTGIVSGDRRLTDDEDCTVRLPPEATHLFDLRSGRALY